MNTRDERIAQRRRREANREFAVAAAKTAMMTMLAFLGFIVMPIFFPLTMLTVAALFLSPVIVRAYFGEQSQSPKRETKATSAAVAPPVGAIPATR